MVAQTSFYDRFKFRLSNNAAQLATSEAYDAEVLARNLSDLQRPEGGDRDLISKYNRDYIELYSPYDSSTEFHAAVNERTFDDSFIMPSFDELTVSYPDDRVPYLDQVSSKKKHLLPHQKYWADHGYLLIEGMISPELCDRYVSLREQLVLGLNRFPTFTPYLQYDLIKDMFCSEEMHFLINDLIGEELGLHFNLSPFTSTERGWHQDEYLNPPETYGRYIAAWIAVDDVPEDSGPFEFIAGSHKLPTVSREKVMPYLKQQYQLGYSPNYDWSVHSAMFVNPAYFFKFAASGNKVTKFLGKKGDVLLWHSRLIHRGAPPVRPGVRRPGIIGHYSPIRTARWFGDDVRRYGSGGYYWNFDE